MFDPGVANRVGQRVATAGEKLISRKVARAASTSGRLASFKTGSTSGCTWPEAKHREAKWEEGFTSTHPYKDNAEKKSSLFVDSRVQNGAIIAINQASSFISALILVIWSTSKIQTSYTLHTSYFGFHISLIIS